MASSDLYARSIHAVLVDAIAFLGMIFLPAWTFDYRRGWAGGPGEKD